MTECYQIYFYRYLGVDFVLPCQYRTETIYLIELKPMYLSFINNYEREKSIGLICAELEGLLTVERGHKFVSKKYIIDTLTVRIGWDGVDSTFIKKCSFNFLSKTGLFKVLVP